MMSRNAAETIVGAIVLGIAIIFAVFLWRFSDVGFDAGQYTVNAKFRSVEGIAVGTDVRLAGVKIGKGVIIQGRIFFKIRGKAFGEMSAEEIEGIISQFRGRKKVNKVTGEEIIE